MHTAHFVMAVRLVPWDEVGFTVLMIQVRWDLLLHCPDAALS